MRNKQFGGVSIFIIIFTSLLVTVVTTSFTQIMIRTQQQASANDLSQSAYDAALAGVEDAKRALIALRKCENTGATCTEIRNKLDSGNCDSLKDITTSSFGQEVQVGDSDLNQAYTCVKVKLQTNQVYDDVQTPIVVPLDSGGQPYNRIRLSWFAQGDIRKIDRFSDRETPEYPGIQPRLPENGSDEWPQFAPALLRTQLIQFTEGTINVGQFENARTNNSKTLFLYPAGGGSGVASADFGSDTRRADELSKNSPTVIPCSNSFNLGGFACSVEITLPNPDGGSPTNREAYLQLQGLYQKISSFKVEMCNTVCNGGNIVKFDTVQPEVDSTGRADSQFRRVMANVSLRNRGIPYQYPDAALKVGGNLCKTFFIGDDKFGREYREYTNETTDNACTP